MKIKAKQLHRHKRRPPKYWKFIVLFGAHMGLLLSIGPAKVLGVFLIRFKEEFDANSGVIGSITTLTYFVLAIAGLVASMLCKMYSCRIITIVGGFVIGLGLVLTSFSKNIFQLFLFIDIFTGIGIGLCGNPCLVVISHYFDKKYATANGFAMAGVDVGIVFLPPLTDYLSGVYGWRGALLILGAMSMNVVAMGALFRPNHHIEDGIADETVNNEEYDESTPQKAERFDNHETNLEVVQPNKLEPLLNNQTKVLNNDESSQNTITDPSPVQEGIVAASSVDDNQPTNDTVSQANVSVVRKFVNSMDLSIFLIPKYLVLMPVTLIVASANSGILAHIVARGISESIPPFSASFLLSGVGVTSLIARCTHGLIIDKGIMSAVRLYTVALTFGSVFTFLSLFCNSFTTFLIYTMSYGIVCGIFQSASIPIVRSTVPSHMLGGAVAWLFIFRGLGAFFGGLIAGSLFDATGNYDCSFMVIAGSFLLSAILMVAFSYAKGCKKRRESIMLDPVELNIHQCVGI